MVIKTVDRLHRLHDDPTQAALVAALTVHADLGGLWQRAGYMIARLDQELHAKNDTNSKDGTYNEEDTALTTVHAWTPAQWLQQPSRFRILHASVALLGYGCPPEMVRLALSLHPDQVRQYDANGNLPLHLACRGRNYLTDPGLLAFCSNSPSMDLDNMDNQSVLSDAALSFFSSATVSNTTHPFDKVIKLLLQHYPQAILCKQQETGLLPTVSALGHRSWKDGLRTLVQAHPAALHYYKYTPSLYAHILALVTTSEPNDWEGLDDTTVVEPKSKDKRQRQRVRARTTLFEMMRTKPDWLN